INYGRIFLSVYFPYSSQDSGYKKTRASAGSAAWQCNHSYHDMQIFTIVNYFFADKILINSKRD
ncbi:hypothetical protein ACUVPF_005205, partial [Escherichia coli]